MQRERGASDAMRFRFLQPHAWLGCASILVDFIGLGMIAPILPGIVSSQAVGNILTAQYLAVVVGQLTIAALSDAIGRRRVIFGVMIFDAILFSATGFTQEVTALIILRLLAGFAAPVALGISYVAAVSVGLPPEKAQLNFAYVGISFNLGSLIGAATGGLLGVDLWLPANLVAGIVPAFVAVWALATIDTAEDMDKWPRRKQLATPSVTGSSCDNATAPTAAAAPVAAPATASTAACTADPIAHTAASGSAPATVSSAAGVSIRTRQNDDEQCGHHGLSGLLRTPEYLSVLLGFIANGFFQGGFFSLMPVLLADTQKEGRAANGTASALGSVSTNQSLASPAGEAADSVSASDDAAPLIAGVIIAAALLQIAANVWGVRLSLRRYGSHGHSARVNVACALGVGIIGLLAEASAGRNGSKRSTLAVGSLGALYAVVYVPSASSLTVLNQVSTAYARRHGAPMGLVTAIGRCLFATAFGIAPAATIKMYNATGNRVVLPLAVMGTMSLLAGLAFVYLSVRRSWSDPMPLNRRQHETAAA